MKNINTTLVVVAVFLAAITYTATVQAEFIPPIGLTLGSPYQLIFVTSGTTDANSSDITFYNSIVTAQAALNPALPTATWSAVASTHAVNANRNALAYGNIPIYNTQGLLVASGYSQLWGTAQEA